MWSGSKLPGSRSYRTDAPTSGLESAVSSFSHGDPVLVHDAAERENEVDLIYSADAVTLEDVTRMRNDAGGLVCVSLSHEVAEAFDLMLMDGHLDHPASDDVELAYDDRSSFSMTVNHRDTHTGITDNDRARTISALGDCALDPDAIDFGATFHTPGHVHLLRAAPGHVENRQGHTELGIALAELADVPPAVVVCEMLDDDTGGALSRSKAARYASEHGYVFLDESTILDDV